MFVTGVNSATAMRIARYQAQALQAVDNSAARISSGRRFTSFAEDPVAATKEISLRAQQGANGIYLRATQDAVAAADLASSGLQTASDILTELRTTVLGMNSADPASVSAAQQTVTQLTDELTRLAQTTTTVAGEKLLDGSIATTGLNFKIAATGSASDTVELNAISIAAADLGTTMQLADIDFAGGTTQADALTAIEEAQAAVTASLSSTGGLSSALGHHVSVLGAQAGGIESALDNLVGVDVAQETLDMTAASIRAESAAAMLAQVNALNASVVRHLLMGY
ncbi:flagellin [Paractinoplanes deccanensis]|uniref:Flagellin n=1 Tax=Paractinoplanes deccanensis TaxID=113561 RepID=A0ABQ3Y5H2_9ACTN|nr:flagellin [Actinoplanes deccanensis]GID75248.1 flagellin [Actinoplanes deccanensis]